MAAIFSDPSRYVGKRLTVFGYLHRVHDHAVTLFLTQDHAIYADYGSAIAIGQPKSSGSEQCTGQYVEVSGVFEKMDGVSLVAGQMYIFPNPEFIRSIRADGERSTCWPEERLHH